MAMSKPSLLDNKTINHARLSIVLLNVCTPLYRDLLRKYVPEHIFYTIFTCEDDLMPKYRKRFFPKPYSSHCRYDDFDISLMYSLIRNSRKLTEHKRGWGNNPDASDDSIAANVERLRIFRNEKYGHLSGTAVDDTEFRKLWIEIRKIVKEIEDHMSPGISKYADDMDRLENLPIDKELYEKCTKQLELTERVLDDVGKVKVGVENLQEQITSTERDVKIMRGKAEYMQEDISSIRRDVKTIKTEVYERHPKEEEYHFARRNVARRRAVIFLGKTHSQVVLQNQELLITPEDRRVVASLDIGTAYSGYCYSSSENFKKDPLKIGVNQWKCGTSTLESPKTPTTVLLDKNKKFHSFGYDAEIEYANIIEEDKQEDFYYFRRFKMDIKNYKKTLTEKTTLKDITFKEVPALTIFKGVINFLVKEVNKCLRREKNVLKEEDIYWILTVPASWSAAEKKFMSDAAIVTGIKAENMLITEEAKAVSYYCKFLPVEISHEEGQRPFRPGSRYIVLDAGGGTVDITAVEVEYDYGLKELDKIDGPFGGITVDDQFMDFLKDIIEKDTLEEYSRRHAADFVQLLNKFELKKRQPCQTQKTLTLPITLLDFFEEKHGITLEEKIKSSCYQENLKLLREKLKINEKLFNSFFTYAIDGIVNLVTKLLESTAVKNTKFIVMVGGFSESHLVKTQVKKSFPECRVIVPADPGLAVLKGAVLFGHEQPSAFTLGKRIGKKYNSVAM